MQLQTLRRRAFSRSGRKLAILNKRLRNVLSFSAISPGFRYFLADIIKLFCTDVCTRVSLATCPFTRPRTPSARETAEDGRVFCSYEAFGLKTERGE